MRSSVFTAKNLFFALAASHLLLIGDALAMPAPPDVPKEVSVDRCVAANTAVQALRRQGKFALARAELAVCSDASCPPLVRDDCSQRLDELDRAQPTIVFEAKDEAGHDVSDVTVEADGRPFAQRLDGIAAPIDPGEHTFTFEMKGQPTKVTHKLVLREGEKGRRESIQFGNPALAAAPKGVVELGPARAGAAPFGAQRIASLALLGAGLAGVGAGVAFAVQAKSQSDDANTYCPGTACSSDAALRMNHDARAAADRATVALVVGAAAVTGGVVLWLTAKPSATAPSAELGLAGGTLRLRGTW